MTQSRFVVVVRDESMAPPPRSPVSPRPRDSDVTQGLTQRLVSQEASVVGPSGPVRQSNRVEEGGIDRNGPSPLHSSDHPSSDRGEEEEDEEETVEEMDIDSFAASVGIDAADLLRYLREHPQEDLSDPRRVATMLQCYAVMQGGVSFQSRLSAADGVRGLTNERPATAMTAEASVMMVEETADEKGDDSSTDRKPASGAGGDGGDATVAAPGGASTTSSSPLRTPASTTSSAQPQLVTLEFISGEEGGLVGGEQQLSPTPPTALHSADGSSHASPSQLVFRYSGSNFSSSSHIHDSQRSLHRNATPQQAKKGISFSTNVVTDVVVYEVDSELYVGVEYSRHWFGWVFLFLGLALGITFDVHITWFVYIARPDAGYISIQNWICVLRAIMSAFYFVCCVLLGIGVAPSLEFSFSVRGFTITSLMSFCLGVALALEVVTSNLASTPHFFTTSVLHCVWIIVFRLVMKEMLFFAEVIGVLVAVVGFVLANVPVDTEISFYTDAVGNVIMLIASILYASYFLIQAWLRQRSPTSPMVLNIGLVAPIVGLILGAAYGGSFTTSSDGMYGMFDSQNIVHASLISMEGLITNVCFLGAMMYLDILSVSTTYAVKSIIAVLVMHLLVWEDNAAIEPQADKDQWGPWFFAGLALVVLGSGIVIYFASVKRRFVARRIAHSSRKQTPNPYRKRRKQTLSSGSAARSNGNGDVVPQDERRVANAQTGVSRESSTFTSARSPSPLRRASSATDKKGGRKVMVS